MQQSKPSIISSQQFSSANYEMTQAPQFEKTNSLLCRNGPTSHKIVDISKKQQNIQLLFIILSKQVPVHTKKDLITKCLIADQSASMFMNFFNQTGVMVQEGDIIYASGVYASHFKQRLLLYQGSMSIIKRVGRHFFRFNISRNMTLESEEMEKGDNNNQGNFKKY